MTRTYLLGDIAEHPEFVAPLADAFEAEWPEWASSVGRDVLEGIFIGGSSGQLPLVLVAWEGDHVVGTIALRQWFADEAMHETPWVRQLLVIPGHRGRGVDRLLGSALEQRAAALGFQHLYAATNRIETLLGRRGWELFRRVKRDGESLAWMRKSIGLPVGST